jgi:hypothetical protein
MADLFFETSVFFAQKNRYLSQSIGFLSRTRFGLNGANLAFDAVAATGVCFINRLGESMHIR